jgi:uncharacterized protein (DUF362 family)
MDNEEEVPMANSRRDFLRSGAALVAAAGSGMPLLGAPTRLPGPYFGLHPFVESHPKAVFVRRTRVPHKMDAAAKHSEGLQLARELFVPLQMPGVPVTHRVVLKPNFTSVRARNRPVEENWGTSTDPNFYEGLIAGLKEIGLRKFSFIEANGFPDWNRHGFVDINERHGVEMNEPERRARNFRDSYEMTWAKVPDAVVYTRIPYYAPVNEPGTWLLNIAKWKAHGMCMTLSVKNEQGLVVLPYVRFCTGWSGLLNVPDFMKPDIHPEAERRLKRYFENHVRLRYSRYDSREDLSPMHQEIWAHKTCDSQSVLRTGLAIIEGICGRDGDGFADGQDYLTNLVFFSRDKFRLDLVATYLAGHEPGNVHLFRIAKERGLSNTFNPWDVPVYEWVDGAPQPRKLSDFPRVPLKTYYLRRDGEPRFHLVNEPFDYDRFPA